MSGAGALALALLLSTSTCQQEKRNMPKAAAQDLQERLRRDFEGRADRPVTDRIPTRGSDGAWKSPEGKPISWSGVIGWTRPPQQDGAPFTAYYCADDQRYWVHQGSGLGGTPFWFGPFELR